MFNTYKTLCPFVTDELMCTQLEKLAEMYQEHALSSILATAYAKTFMFCINQNKKYPGLDEADEASWCLEKLDYCLKTYDKSFKCKFLTYFGKVYCNRLREATEAMNCKKRKCILESINDILSEGVEDTYNLLTELLPSNLTEKERRYCELAWEGYDNGYIADDLHVSKMTISNIRKSLRVKCATLQN